MVLLLYYYYTTTVLLLYYYCTTVLQVRPRPPLQTSPQLQKKRHQHYSGFQVVWGGGAVY